MNTLLKTAFALLLVALTLAGDTAPPAKADKSKFALLNSDKSTLNEEDLSTIFQQDMSSLGKSDTMIDDQCSAKLDIALKGAASDANALAFIFTQATEGRLCAMLNQKQGDIDNAAKAFKDTEGFSPVANNKAPVLNMPKLPATAAPVAKPATIKIPDTVAPVDTATIKMPAANNSAVVTAAVNVPVSNSTAAVNSADAVKTATSTNTSIGNVAAKSNGADSSVATGNNVDPKVVAAQKAKQEEQMKAAQEAINNLFAQVGTKMNTNAAIPAINFGGAPASNATAPSADLGAGLARVSVATTPNK